jgi:hypothetical protein
MHLFACYEYIPGALLFILSAYCLEKTIMRFDILRLQSSRSVKEGISRKRSGSSRSTKKRSNGKKHKDRHEATNRDNDLPVIDRIPTAVEYTSSSESSSTDCFSEKYATPYLERTRESLLSEDCDGDVAIDDFIYQDRYAIDPFEKCRSSSGDSGEQCPEGNLVGASFHQRFRIDIQEDSSSDEDVERKLVNHNFFRFSCFSPLPRTVHDHEGFSLE